MLNQKRLELRDLRRRFFSGEPVKTEMMALATECADLYNAKAKEVAKRLGIKPRLTSPQRVLRHGEFVR